LKEVISPQLILVGTAHVSPDSVREVEEVIRAEDPDIVAIELDPARLDALENKKKWENTPIQKLLKNDKLWLFLTQSLLASYQRRLGEQLGAEPGSEMLMAVTTARAMNKEILLADRDIGITMKRAYRMMRFREKIRMMWELLKSFVGGEAEPDADQKPIDMKEMMKEDVISQMMNELGQMAPSIKSVVLDERDAYLATKIRLPVEEGKKVVAIVGAGHVAGIRQRLKEPPQPLAPLEVIPAKKFPWGKVIGWLLPLFIVGLFVWFGYEGYKEGNFEKLRDAALYWILITGSFAAVGTALARGHIISIITAFIAAPITTLHPALAAGWFAGIAEAYVRTPLVKDFQGLSTAKSMKEYFGNRVIRVLLVAMFANIGAMIGFFVAGAEILRRFVEG
jgi:pheromone shutdown-related protein TraB